MTAEPLAPVMAAVLFSALGAWLGDVVWASLIGGALGGLIVTAGDIVEVRNGRSRGR